MSTSPDDILAVETAVVGTAAGISLPAASTSNAPARRGGMRDLLRGTARVNRARVGAAAVLAVVAVALIGPLFAPHNPDVLLAAPYARAGQEHLLFGADYLGRDVLSRFLDGGRAILVMALLAAILGVGGGALLGLTAGYRRGIRGESIMRSLDVVLSFPPLVLALLFVSILGPKLWLIVLTVAATHVPRTARVIYSAALQVTRQPFVQYAEAIGVPRRRIILGDLLPNVIAPLMVEFGLRFCWSIGIIASLAYLGLGPQPPTADWGLMINENQSAITVQPWPVLLPIMAIALLTIGTNLATDAFAQTAAGIDRGLVEDSV